MWKGPSKAKSRRGVEQTPTLGSAIGEMFCKRSIAIYTAAGGVLRFEH